MEIIEKYHQIKLKDQDVNLDTIKEFLDHLRKDYEDFKKELYAATKEWDALLENSGDNNKGIFFVPEKTIIKSPTTIIDAPWGMGKTHFIEEIGKYLLKGKLNKYNFFKNIVIIDTWKFCNYDDMVNKVINELVLVFSKSENFEISLSDNEKKSFFKKMGSSINSFLWSSEFTFCKDGVKISFAKEKYDKNNEDKKNKEEQKNIDELVNKILEQPPKTLIFFDNIERLGSFSWDVIKLVQKLSAINNLIIIFPMDKNKLKVMDFNPISSNEFDGEKYIEKYIQLKYYRLVQDYRNILVKFKFRSEYISDINFILSTERNDKFFSIREIEKLFKDDKVKLSFDHGKYSGLKELRNFLNPQNINRERIGRIDGLIKNDISLILNFNKEISEWKNKLDEYIKENENLDKFLKFCYIYHEIIKEDIDKQEIHFLKLIKGEKEMNFLENIFFDWNNLTNNITKEQLYFFGNETNNKIIKIASIANKQIDLIALEIDKLKPLLSNINNEIYNYQRYAFSYRSEELGKMNTKRSEIDSQLNKNILLKGKYEELTATAEFLKNNPLNIQFKKIKEMSKEFVKVKNNFINHDDRKQMWGYISEFNEKLINEKRDKTTLVREEIDAYILEKILG